MVLNLFVEYSEHVVIDSFTISLLAAVLLQVLLKLTIAIEHRVAAYFKAKPGGFWKFMRYFSAWLHHLRVQVRHPRGARLRFGDDVHFGGPFHGLVVLIVVVIVMLLVEEAIVQLYRRLPDDRKPRRSSSAHVDQRSDAPQVPVQRTSRRP